MSSTQTIKAGKSRLAHWYAKRAFYYEKGDGMHRTAPGFVRPRAGIVSIKL